MAEALARGLIAKNIVPGSRMFCSDPNPQRNDVFKSFGATPYDSNVDVSSGAQLVHVGTKQCSAHN
jgi:pyrroline-5-carboxylate reductase